MEPSLLLAEVSGSVARQTGVPALGARALAAILSLPSTRIVTMDSELIDLAARVASYHRLRGADAIYIALARQLDMPLVTWDREQLERAAGIRTRTPTA